MVSKFKVDFFKISISDPNPAITFEFLVAQAFAKSPPDRVIIVGKTPVMLHEASIDQSFVEGELVRLSMDDIPFKGSLSGKVEPISLNDDEGIGDSVAFLYHIPTKVFLKQTSKTKIYPGRICEYFQKINQLQGYIIADPILQLDALRKLDRMHEIKKFEISIAGIKNMNAVCHNGDIGVSDFVKLARFFQSPSINLTVSTGGYKNQSLSINSVKQTAINIGRLFSTGMGQVKKISITGNVTGDDEEQSIFLDLLKDKMQEEIEHTFSNRVFPYSERKALLKKAWQNREKEILEMYG